MTRADQARRYLAEIPELYALLPLFVLPGTGVTSEGGGSGDPARPPATLDILDLLDQREKRDTEWTRIEYLDLDRLAGARRQGVLPVLVGWTRLVDCELTDADLAHQAPDENPTVTGECAYLASHLPWLVEQQWFTELETDLKSLRRDLRDAIHEVDPPALRCTNRACDWPVDAMDNGTWFRCTGCDMTWTQAEVSRLYAQQQPMSLTECADLLGRPVKTLHDWRGRGWLTPIGRDHRGSLYEYQQVVDVAASTVHGVKRDTPA